MSYRPDTSRPLPCPHMKADKTCDACRGSRGCIAPTEFEMVPVSSQAAPTEQIGAKMPCGAVVTNVYEAYEAGRKSVFVGSQAAPDAKAEPADPIRRIITGVREFYLGLLSRHLPSEAFDMARADNSTMVAYQGVTEHFLTLVESVKAAPVELTDEQIMDVIDASGISEKVYNYITLTQLARAILAAQAAQKGAK